MSSLKDHAIVGLGRINGESHAVLVELLFRKRDITVYRLTLDYARLAGATFTALALIGNERAGINQSIKDRRAGFNTERHTG